MAGSLLCQAGMVGECLQLHDRKSLLYRFTKSNSKYSLSAIY